MKRHVGLDIGSISLNTVVMDDERNILENHYTYCHGKPFHVLKSVLEQLLTRHDPASLGTIAITGTGGKVAVDLVGGHFVNEIVAQSASVATLFPDARTVIEMGGEDSKLILMERKAGESRSQLADFAMNSICAAGTGSFLDQQARRIGISIEEEFGRLAMQSVSPPRIAGRCSVFAKSDMIHLQQIATPVEDIVAGLCFAVARNFKSSLASGKQLTPPVVFQGGVAANQGVVRAFREILDLHDGELIIPEYHASMGAIGALIYVLDHPPHMESSFRGLIDLESYLHSQQSDGTRLEPLSAPNGGGHKDIVVQTGGAEKLPVYLGVDVGSLSTNVVLIDEKNNVVARRYLPTASRPLEALRRGLSEIAEEVDGKVLVCGAGTTGSGRYLTGDFIGADTIQNEITAQATAAIAHDSTVDTIFEIGGQDSKFISIDDGVVVDFEMNKVCAAGTGSFLEEQAEKLGIRIEGDFQDFALSSNGPARLGDRCTVFMESDLNSHQQKGVAKEDLIAGLAYSIVHNYIEKVVGNKRIGNKIFFQGGVTNNKSVVSAFEKVTGKPIIVPPHFDVTGAIGAAMLARDVVREKRHQDVTAHEGNGSGKASLNSHTRFKGFDISRVPYSLDKFTCKSCANQCEIRKVKIEGERKPLYYGGRCEQWEIEERKGRGQGITNYFEERLSLLLGDYEDRAALEADAKPEEKAGEAAADDGNNDSRKTVGIPRNLMVFFQQFPFWRTFFEELGYRVVLSRPADRKLVTTSLEMLSAETCFPVELMHGHVHDLLERNVDYVFMPFIITGEADKQNPTVNYNCPWIQSYPFMIHSAYKGDPRAEKFLTPTLHFRYGPKVLEKQMSEFMSEKLGVGKVEVRRALGEAARKQNQFLESVAAHGRAAIEQLPSDKVAVVILSRPYNGGDPELNLHLVEKLINLDVVPLPVDYLPISNENIFDEYPMMYWPNGRRILSAARIVSRDDRLNAVYLGNFRCGPDSFLLHYIREEMKGKPFLQLEVDEHGADAGMITRCEAFLDSLRGYLKVSAAKRSQKAFASPIVPENPGTDGDGRVLYFPYMCDQAYALAAAARSCGVDAQVLPMQGEREVELGRKYTSSRECFPMICTTGSFIRKMQEPDFDPKKASFFMPSHNGPCRFGQYNKLQRQIFDHLGFQEVEIFAPRNDDSYEDLSRGHGTKFRMTAWKGVVAVDLLRKLLQERRPYEAVAGETNRVYAHWLQEVVECVEKGGHGLSELMVRAAASFAGIELKPQQRKPVIAVVGEIFMRDNPFCSGFLVERLEALGAETVIAPVREWISYSTYRYWRDSVWKSDFGGLVKSKIQEVFQERSAHALEKTIKEVADTDMDVTLGEMLSLCSPYVHRHYDGDPIMALGAASKLAEAGASGVANLLPFTCMPGTLITAVSPSFRKDHNNIPWVNIAYDGQDDTGIETRLQAFMHQAREYARLHNLDIPIGERTGASTV